MYVSCFSPFASTAFNLLARFLIRLSTKETLLAWHLCFHLCSRTTRHKKIFNPPPQFSRLGTLCPTLWLVVCLFVSLDRGFLGFFFLLSVCLLYSVLYTYMYMYMYQLLHVQCMCIYSTLANRKKGGERNPRNPHPMKRTNKQQKSRTQGAQP